MLQNVLNALGIILGHLISPVENFVVPKLIAEEITLADALLRRFAPDADVQGLALSLLNNPNHAAVAVAASKLTDYQRSIAQVAKAVLPTPQEVAPLPAAKPITQPANAGSVAVSAPSAAPAPF